MLSFDFLGGSTDAGLAAFCSGHFEIAYGSVELHRASGRGDFSDDWESAHADNRTGFNRR
mgnify:CR=1 FL=1